MTVGCTSAVAEGAGVGGVVGGGGRLLTAAVGVAVGVGRAGRGGAVHGGHGAGGAGAGCHGWVSPPCTGRGWAGSTGVAGIRM